MFLGLEKVNKKQLKSAFFLCRTYELKLSNLSWDLNSFKKELQEGIHVDHRKLDDSLLF